jgi:nitroreductase
MNVSDAIRSKRAIRRFASEPLADEAITAILNAGRRAQSSKNSQPWQFVAITNREILEYLSHAGDFAAHLAGAALGVALVAPDETERHDWLMFDLGQAASYMQLAAWELGIGSVIATIYRPEVAGEILHIPSAMRCDVALSFGYPADREELAAQPRPGGRKPLAELVHWDQW